MIVTAAASVVRELRYATRGLRKSPGFSAAAIATLTAGIAASTVMFSILHGVVLARLPYREPERLMAVWEVGPEGRLWRPAPATLREWREHARAFESLAAFQGATWTLTDQGEPVSLHGTRVEPGYFGLLGISPILGRTFLPDEAKSGAPPVVALGYDLWRTRFGGDPEILGRPVTLEGTPRTVVGVLPRAPYPASALTVGKIGFASGGPEFFVPADLERVGAPSGRSHVLGVLGRLADGVTPEAAQKEMTSLARRLTAADTSQRSADVSLTPLDRETQGAMRPALTLLFAAVLFVLAISGANVTGLALARSQARGREMAVRAALGAGRLRIASGVLLESGIVAVAAGALGIVFSYWGLPALLALMPDVPRLGEVRIHGGVLAFAVAVSVCVGVLSGIVPALAASRRAASRSLAGAARGVTDSRGARRSLSLLVVAETAIAVLLASGAVLLTRSFLELSHVDPGFRADGVTVAQLSLPRSRYGTYEDVARLQDALVTSVRALPGVASASLAYNHPLEAHWMGSGEAVPGPDEPAGDRPPAWFRAIGEGYFASVGVPILEGRDFAATDDLRRPPVALVNEAFARANFPGGRALGRFIESADAVSWWDESLPTRFEIVGVVQDVLFLGLDKPSSPAYYLSLRQFPIEDVNLVVRGAVEAPALARVLHALDPALPFQKIEALPRLYAEALGPSRLAMRLMLAFGGAAVLLAMLGVYGLMSYVVTLRRRELSIRIALGARRSQVLETILAETGRLAAGGIVLGLAGAVAAKPLISRVLYGVGAADPASLLGAAAALAAVLFLASGLPARRAARIAPSEALKGE